MNAHTALLEQWRVALAHILGADPSRCFSRLPSAEIPPRFPVFYKDDCDCSRSAGQKKAARALGAVLGIVAIRAGHLTGYGNHEQVSRDLRFLHMRLSCGEEIRDSVFRVIGQVLDLTRATPYRFPALYARIGALSRADLLCMALNAVQGLGSEDMLSDLCEPAEAPRLPVNNAPLAMS